MLGGGEVAIEVKGTARIDKRDLRSLKIFSEAYSPRKSLVICNEKEERVHEQIQILPWRNFLHKLWEGKIIN